jgi:ParB family chromosome partitioning protein
MNRRNLTPQEAALIRGRLYEARKQAHGGDRKSIRQNDGLKQTSEAIAAESGVSPRTVERDAEFALAVDALAAVDKDIVQRATRGVEDVNGEVSSVSRSDVLKAAAALESGDKKKAKKILFKPTVHVSNNSGEQEWFTPAKFIDAARECMGGIDLDPASCAAANKTVKAKEYFDVRKDGLKQDWHGRVWLNPPYSRPAVEQFCQKTVSELDAGNLKSVCVLTNNFTETAAGQLLLSKASAVLFVAGRIAFIDRDGEENGMPLQGQMIAGFNVTFTDFKAAFSEFGIVLRP